MLLKFCCDGEENEQLEYVSGGGIVVSCGFDAVTEGGRVFSNNWDLSGDSGHRVHKAQKGQRVWICYLTPMQRAEMVRSDIYSGWGKSCFYCSIPQSCII